jgi:hypothetical protein
MPEAAAEGLRGAYKAIEGGDPARVAALFTPTTVWRGIERGRLWLRKHHQADKAPTSVTPRRRWR